MVVPFPGAPLIFICPPISLALSRIPIMPNEFLLDISDSLIPIPSSLTLRVSRSFSFFRKTTTFYKSVHARFENDLGNVNRYMVNHFRDRWNTDKNIYDEYIEKNITHLKHILKLRGHIT